LKILLTLIPQTVSNNTQKLSRTEQIALKKNINKKEDLQKIAGKNLPQKEKAISKNRPEKRKQPLNNINNETKHFSKVKIKQ